MRNQLYVANLAESVTEEQLRELFGEYGDVENIDMGVEEKTGMRYALVDMASEKIANRANFGLNGHELEGEHLSISPPEPDIERRLTNKQRKIAESIVAELEETEKVPVRQIHTMVQLCGTAFAQALLEEVKVVEAGEGVKTSDGERRRTKGGVFFYLARYRMTHDQRRIIFNRKGKLPVETESDDAESSDS